MTHSTALTLSLIGAFTPLLFSTESTGHITTLNFIFWFWLYLHETTTVDYSYHTYDD